MKRLGNLLRKDILLGIKDVFILLEIAFAIIIACLVVFIVPKEIDQNASVYIMDQSSILPDMSMFSDEEVPDHTEQFFVSSRDEMIAGMKDNKSAVGLILSVDDQGLYHAELLTQPYTPGAMIDFFEVQISDMLAMIRPPSGAYAPDVYESVRVTALQEGLRDTIPFNQRLLPIMLFMMVGMVGLFAMVSLVGQERSDATIRAYKVTPARLWEFLLSKHIMLLLTGFVTFSILYIPVMGLSGYLNALLIIIPTILLGSGIGIILGSFFDQPMASIGWIFLLMIVFALPAISLFAPVFSPDWLKIIPSYHTLFGLDAAMFPDNNAHIIWERFAILSGVAAVLISISGFIFSKRMRKEA